ncbi:ribonuclease HII [Rhodohalobacter sp. 614A]|uniref:ribonuclease HII n=1 Tax=Rhodohalobacter sp. 614A TaxID=2908649 RepID=UPI001F377B81|nr:ribonuclease HII [Rhodohalobacter sp. 614A]
MDRYHYEKNLWVQGYQRVMGLDEVGRGCLCGPVVAAGVILKPHTQLSEEIADSKTLDEKDRVRLAVEIKEKASFWTIQQCSVKEIDDINILKASFKAMIRCSEADGAEPDYLLVDGNMFSPTVIPHSCIVKGDDKSASIAAASILAKVHRDNLMKKLHEEYPVFGWKTNVGYATKEHFAGLEKHGYTEHHRLSFSLRTTKVFERSE